MRTGSVSSAAPFGVIDRHRRELALARETLRRRLVGPVRLHLRERRRIRTRVLQVFGREPAHARGGDGGLLARLAPEAERRGEPGERRSARRLRRGDRRCRKTQVEDAHPALLSAGFDLRPSAAARDHPDGGVLGQGRDRARLGRAAVLELGGAIGERLFLAPCRGSERANEGHGQGAKIHARMIAQWISTVASPSSSPMLATSVAVVTMMLEAVAGSAPRRFRASGTKAPEMPLTAQLPIIARNTATPSMNACGDSWESASRYMAMPHRSPVTAPLSKPSIASLDMSDAPPPLRMAFRVMPRTVTASAWQPVLPDCPASTGRNVARITSRSTVPWKTATTPPAANAVSRLMSSHGWRNLKLCMS